MDKLLAVPDNAAFPPGQAPTVPRTPCVCRPEDRWDGGPFFTYATRRGRTDIVAEWLREPHGIPDTPGSSTKKSWVLSGEGADLHSLLQSWFFFGLAAEFFDLNRPQPWGAADPKLARFLGDLISVDADGRTYLDASPILQKFSEPWEAVVQDWLQLADDGTLQHRLEHWARVLRFTYNMLSNLLSRFSSFDHAVFYSCCALGDYLVSAIQILLHQVQIARPRIPLRRPKLDPIWKMRYLHPGGDVERRMLADGWCLADIQRIRDMNVGLHLTHFLCHIQKDKPETSEQHQDCNSDTCKRWQIDKATYRTRHTDQCHGCSMLVVDQLEVTRVLQSGRYPVLRVDISPGPQSSVTAIGIEQVDKDVPYIALSHASL